MDINRISRICIEHGIENYNINKDGSIDVDGNVTLKWIPLKFGKVSGDFAVFHPGADGTTPQTKNWDNFPHTIGGSFWCNHTLIENFIGCPKNIGGSFRCNDNRIYTFEGLDSNLVREIHRRNDQCIFYFQPIDWIYQLHPCPDFIDILNENQVIRKGKVIHYERLINSLEEVGVDKIPDDQLKYIKKEYILI